ncbi:hypothetical protein GGR54DRAFT_620587 [Hypoxylon sp. NC1633]|nr:hypothetical protein GGR54DRAFT_620587 [Hypoxylon sp. NC1633]
MVQILLPTNFPQLYGRGLRSPAKIVSKGAVIFGHSWKFPLRWSLTKDAPPEEGEPDLPSVDEVSGLFHDSGIGTSHNSSLDRSDMASLSSSVPSAAPSATPHGSDSSSSQRAVSANEATDVGPEDEPFVSLGRSSRKRPVSPPGDSLAMPEKKLRHVMRRI